ncbi:hypothetical protein D3C75_773820 [compost metagenome]
MRGNSQTSNPPAAGRRTGASMSCGSGMIRGGGEFPRGLLSFCSSGDKVRRSSGDRYCPADSRPGTGSAAGCTTLAAVRESGCRLAGACAGERWPEITASRLAACSFW